MAADVREGLRATSRSCRRSTSTTSAAPQLFDRITELPEYYPTRCERAILNRYAPEIVDRAGATELVELGSGSASKTRALLFAMAGEGTLERYVPVDCSKSVVERSRRGADRGLPRPRWCTGWSATSRSTSSTCRTASGGCSPSSAARSATSTRPSAPGSCALLRGLMGPEDRLLLGTDLVKDDASARGRLQRLGRGHRRVQPQRAARDQPRAWTPTSTRTRSSTSPSSMRTELDRDAPAGGRGAQDVEIEAVGTRR